ncbi:MAG: hypothetical protein NAOJABEB_03142 [Steroidobacteraceae bacterium]|nr:hypothetical protein [Steroidobacteraceae bacterium]
MDDMLIAFGNEVKALGAGRVGGYLVRFGDQTATDLEGDFFTAQTDFDIEFPAQATVYYNHGFDPVLKRRKLGRADLRADDAGIWVEAQLAIRDEYEQAIYAMAEDGKLGWSSGTAPHLVEREDVGAAKMITRWPLGLDASLTPTPAEPRNTVVSIKSIFQDVEAEGVAGAEVTISAPREADTSTDMADDAGQQETKTMSDETIVTQTEQPADIDALVNAKVAEAINAKVAEAIKALAAQPPVNDVPIDVPHFNKYGRGDDATKGYLHYIRTGDLAGLGVKAYNNTDMNIGTPADGGYAVPTGLHNEIIARRDELSLVPKLGVRRIPGKGTTVRVPVDGEADVLFTSVNEAAPIGQDAPALGYVDMTLVKYAKYITLSWELLRDEDANLQAFLNDWISRGLAATMNNLLITEALANGTAGLTLDAAAAIGAAEIPELEGKLLPEYQDGAQWIMHPTTYAYLRGLFGTSAFVFSPGTDGVTPGFGYPVNRSSYATALGASAKSLIFGNFNFMGIREGTELTTLRDPYSAAGTGQVKLYYYFDVDFGVLQAEAIQYATHPSA